MEEASSASLAPSSTAAARDDSLHILSNPWDPGEVRIGDASQTIEQLAPGENLSLLVKRSYPGLGHLAAYYQEKFSSLRQRDDSTASSWGGWFRLSAEEADRRIREDVEERIQTCQRQISVLLQQVATLQCSTTTTFEQAKSRREKSEQPEGSVREASTAMSKDASRTKKRAKEKCDKMERFTVVTKAGVQALFRSK
jgi:hypothetical protein